MFERIVVYCMVNCCCRKKGDVKQKAQSELSKYARRPGQDSGYESSRASKKQPQAQRNQQSN